VSIANSIHDRARGRWSGILAALGLEQKFLNGKHGPCPLCGGKDRYRWTNKDGSGSFYCSQCSQTQNTGVDLVMKFKQLNFLEAKRLIEGVIGEAPVVAPKAGKSEDQQRDQMAALWGRARALDGRDVASRYLGARGIKPEAFPASLRWLPDLPFWDEAKTRTLHPALLAKFVAPDNSGAILHRTFLAEPGVKADLPKVRMFMPGRVPAGGAVRLAPVEDTLGISEGLETALSAMLLRRVPVWATLTAGNLMKWVPPKEARNIIIFGDRDKSFTGQLTSYQLAHRLRLEGFWVQVQFADAMPDADTDCDWNDALRQEQAA
jgi:putative DNA primase/helicase